MLHFDAKLCNYLLLVVDLTVTSFSCIRLNLYLIGLLTVETFSFLGEGAVSSCGCSSVGAGAGAGAVAAGVAAAGVCTGGE